MDVLVTLNNTRSGRDKVFRLAQYALKLIGGLRSVPGGSIKTVESNIASLRKLLRFGTFLDTLYGIKRTIQYGDPNLKIITTMIRLALAGYLITDHLVWLKQAGVIDINDRFTQRRSDQYWLLSIMFSLVRAAYDLAANTADRRRRKEDEKNGHHSKTPVSQEWKLFLMQNKAVLLELLNNSLDIWLPLHYLSYVPLPTWLVGAIGTVSSITAALPKLDPSFNLHPPN